MTDSLPVIATSGPSSTYPQRAYRNPTDALVKFLDYKHGAQWSIWEFRAEGTGYPDSEVYHRIRHYPWPDHHPPPFALVPNIMASMRDWLKPPKAEDGKGRTVVVHCKAGKGRSGTMACSYLISEEGWAVKDALERFTQRRMRVGFGNGISIPSQLRWIIYVEQWAKHGRTYIEREIEILEVHAYGLRDGVSVGIEGFVDEGRTIKSFHTFSKLERTPVKSPTFDASNPSSNTSGNVSSPTSPSDEAPQSFIFRPSSPILLPTSDVNLSLERRNKALYGLSMLTSVAHVWFNCYFEGNGPSLHPSPPLPSGVFAIEWEAMDGIKGSARKGTKALDKVSVVWREKESADKAAKIISEPAPGEEVPQSRAADWAQTKSKADGVQSGLEELGLKADTDSRASSTTQLADREGVVADQDAVKSHHTDGLEAPRKPHQV